MTKVRINLGVCDEGNSVKLFAVYNTAHNDLLVLARDSLAAIDIVHQANHLHWMGFIRKDRSYPHAQEIGRPSGSQLSDHWASIQRAISMRIEGTIHFDDGRLVVGNQIIG